jgi:hypothetical protein
MFKYAAMIIGLIVMCVPEDAGFLRFAVQAFIGLSIFMVGAISAITEESN